MILPNTEYLNRLPILKAEIDFNLTRQDISPAAIREEVDRCERLIDEYKSHLTPSVAAQDAREIATFFSFLTHGRALVAVKMEETRIEAG